MASKLTSLDKVLREFGFTPEDFPAQLVANPKLLRYAEDLPLELRAEYLRALRDFFRIYQKLSGAQRAEMLERFEAQLQDEFARQRVAH